MQRPLKILVVDDTLANILPVQVTAQKMGHEVVTARDGREGVEAYQREQPDLVIMDVMMPVMDGLDATRHIRRLPREKWVPIIFYSALDSVADVVRGLECGGDDYLAKPAALDLIRAKIHSFARVLHLQDESLQYSRELEMWRDESEHQSALGQHVISHLVDAQGLRDPWLRWFNIPAQTFSGDLLCAARAPGNVLYVMLADATGHGLAAALSSLPLSQIFYGMTAKGFPLRAIAEELNRKIHGLMPADRFVAATLACIDARNRTIEIWNGGNPSALLVGADGSILMRWPSRHPPLGILRDTLFSGITETIAYQEAGDLLLCTDGVIEAESPEGRPFGVVALEGILADAAPGQRLDRLKQGLIGHLGGQEGHDDISCLLIQAPLDDQTDMAAPAPGRSTPKLRVSEWRMELTWGSDELSSLDVVPIVMSMLGQIKALEPHQGSLFLILSELFNNALDHGLLGLDSGLKAQPDGFDHYLQMREARLAALNHGRIDMSFHLYMEGDIPRLDVTLADSGAGFDYGRLLTRAEGTDLGNLPHGRGITLVRSLCQELIYSGSGNRVLARLNI